MPIGVRDTPNMSGKHPGRDPQVSTATHFMLKWDSMLVPQAVQAAKFTDIVFKGGEAWALEAP